MENGSMDLVLFGPPAAGKGTQGSRLSETFGTPSISTGQLLRAEMKAGTSLGKKLEEYMYSGGLVPNDLVTSLLTKRLDEPDALNGAIFDGYPRTYEQAYILDALLYLRDRSTKKVIVIEVPDEELIKRVTGRRMDANTGVVYHLEYNLPPPGAELIQRPDDTEEIMVRRLEAYKTKTTPTLPYYEEKNLVARIDGVEL